MIEDMYVVMQRIAELSSRFGLKRHDVKPEEQPVSSFEEELSNIERIKNQELLISSKDPADKRAGLILTAAGALTVLSALPIPVISGFSKVLLGIGVFGLLALGVINAVKFFRGLKQRS